MTGKNNFEHWLMTSFTLASGARSKAWQARSNPARPGFPGKLGLEKPGKSVQGQGFEVSLAIEAWLFWPH